MKDTEKEDRNLLRKIADSAPLSVVRKAIVSGVDLIPGEPDEVPDEAVQSAKTRFESFGGE